MTDRPQLKTSITEVVKEEEYTLKSLTTISTFLQDLGRKQWPDMFLDIFALGEFIHEIKDSLYTDDVTYFQLPMTVPHTTSVGAEHVDALPIRSRKEKPPRSARGTMKVGSGGNPLGAGLVILICILTVIMCLIGLFNSLK